MDIAALKAVGTFLGSAGTGAAVPLVAMYMLFTPKEVYYRHVADSTAGYVLDLVRDASAESDGPYKDSLCRSLEEAIGKLCADAPNHSMCTDRAALREKAGCN